MSDLATILGLTLAACLVVGLVGAGLLHAVRRRSLRYQLTIATLVPVVAVAAAVVINVQFMFLSSHDSVVILVALVTSLLLALLGAYLVNGVKSRAASSASGSPAPRSPAGS